MADPSIEKPNPLEEHKPAPPTPAAAPAAPEILSTERVGATPVEVVKAVAPPPSPKPEVVKEVTVVTEKPAPPPAAIILPPPPPPPPAAGALEHDLKPTPLPIDKYQDTVVVATTKKIVVEPAPVPPTPAPAPAIATKPAPMTQVAPAPHAPVVVEETITTTTGKSHMTLTSRMKRKVLLLWWKVHGLKPKWLGRKKVVAV